MDRRSFLRLSAGSAVGLACLGTPPWPAGRRPLPGAPATRADGLEPVGLQLYTVRRLMADDVAGTLRTVAAVGYREVEFAGYFGHPPDRLRRLLDDLGLAAPSTHVGIPALRARLPALLETAAVLGHRHLVLPSLPGEARGSLERFRRLCDELNRIGEACRAAGVQFAFHNHASEFEALEGEVPYDVMLATCDPELVAMQLDLFWMRAGGRDPLDYFAAHPGRFHTCHVKDIDADGRMVDVGAGEIDFAAIFAEADRAGLKHYFVEHDQPADPEASIRASFAYLSALSP